MKHHDIIENLVWCTFAVIGVIFLVVGILPESAYLDHVDTGTRKGTTIQGRNELNDIFTGLGAIFTLIGGTAIFIKLRKVKLEKKLKEIGEIIYATYVETTCNWSCTINGHNPFNIICEWNNPEDGKKYILKSNDILYNPENIIKEKNITNFPVYINLQDKSQYLINIDCLTEDVVDLR